MKNHGGLKSSVFLDEVGSKLSDLSLEALEILESLPQVSLCVGQALLWQNQPGYGWWIWCALPLTYFLHKNWHIFCTRIKHQHWKHKQMHDSGFDQQKAKLGHFYIQGMTYIYKKKNRNKQNTSETTTGEPFTQNHEVFTQHPVAIASGASRRRVVLPTVLADSQGQPLRITIVGAPHGLGLRELLWPSEKSSWAHFTCMTIPSYTCSS